jgi:sugar phosphate isomerase/epimerase
MPLVVLSTGSLYTYGIRRVFELAREIGFDGLEVLVDQRPDTFQPHYLRRLMQEQGLPILALHSPFLPAPGWEKGNLACVRRTVTLAQEVGAGVVIAHLPHRISRIVVQFLWGEGHHAVLPVPWGGDREWLGFIQGSLAQLEAATGVTIAVENMPARRIGPFRLDRRWLWGHDPLTFYERLKDRIAHVHLSNFNGEEHRLLDDGDLPLGQLLERLKGDGYKGLITFETNPNALEAEDEAQVRRNLHRNLGFCRQHLAMD